jgi:putative membrane protein
MSVIRYLPAVAIAALLCVSPAVAKDNAQSFVNKAAVGGMFEVQSSELALKKSKDADVRQFAEMMVADHSKANNTLKSVAQQEGLTVPTELDHKHANTLKELRNAGSQFDAPYIKAQLQGHETTVKLFERYSNAGDNKALRNFAAETLPTLRMHLNRIEQISNRVSSTK